MGRAASRRLLDRHMAATRCGPARPTITGSIGIFAMLPDSSGLLGCPGLTVGPGGGWGTTAAGGLDTPPLDPQIASLLRASIEHGYGALSRSLPGPPDEPGGRRPGGPGRVWLGSQAVERELIGQTGRRERLDAASIATARAGPGRLRGELHPRSPCRRATGCWRA